MPLKPVQPRVAFRLKDFEVKDAKPHDDPTKRRVLADGYGLRLVVTPAGQKYWQFKTAVGGKERLVQLGIYPEMSLKAARDAAAEARGHVKQGHDPVQVKALAVLRNQESATQTLSDWVEELLQVKQANCSPAYYKKVSSSLRANLVPVLGNLPIQKVGASELKTALRRIERRGSLEMLGNVRRWAGEVFDLAKAHGAFSGDNPAHALRRNVFKQHRGENMVSLPWESVPTFMAAIDGCERVAPEVAAAVRLLLLTAVRPGEARGARWEEFHIDDGYWLIPAERMKKRIRHKVPLSRQVVALLADLRILTGHSEYLFPARRGAKGDTISDATLLAAVRRLSGIRIHAHGLRSTFATYVSESLKWDDKLKEAALSHFKVGVEGRYDRAVHYFERIPLMQWWADEIDRACKASNVVALGRARAA